MKIHYRRDDFVADDGSYLENCNQSSRSDPEAVANRRAIEDMAEREWLRKAISEIWEEDQ